MIQIVLYPIWDVSLIFVLLNNNPGFALILMGRYSEEYLSKSACFELTPIKGVFFLLKLHINLEMDRFAVSIDRWIPVDVEVVVFLKF